MIPDRPDRDRGRVVSGWAKWPWTRCPARREVVPAVERIVADRLAAERTTEQAGLAEYVQVALEAFRRACEDERRSVSLDQWGHPGAHVPGAWPTRERQVAAIAEALRSWPGKQHA